MSSDLTRQTRERQQQAQQTTDAAQRAIAAVTGQASGLGAALAERIGPDRFIRAAITEIRTTKNLELCTTDSLLGGLYVAAQLGLEVGGPRGLVYLVPYRNKETGVYEASLIIGYKGWVELFYRAGARAVQWFLIREGDVFRIGSDAVRGKIYTWEQADPNSTARVTGAVAQVVTATGGVAWEYLSRADIDKRATDTPFWRRWWDEMALKTVMRRLAATAPMSTDLALAQHADETVQRRIEVPGSGPEIHGTHLPVAGTRPAVEQRPTAPPPPATPSPRPAPAPRPTPPQPPRQDAEPEPAAEEPIVAAEPADPDWKARERAEYDAWLAEQQDAETGR
jgi:recombination protein RecT